MALFRRNKNAQPGPDDPASTDESSPAGPAGTADLADIAETTDPGGDAPPARATLLAPEDVEDPASYVDLGAVWIRPRGDLQLVFQAEGDAQQLVGVQLQVADSALAISAYAAPRSLGVWQEIRDEIAAKVEEAGGQHELRPGRFGAELIAQLPTPHGTVETARFVGIDGPRWFLRVTVTGLGAIDAQAGEAVDDVIADLVVVRGEAPMAPREVLALSVPAAAQPLPPQGMTPPPSLDPFARGPEITEVH